MSMVDRDVSSHCGKKRPRRDSLYSSSSAIEVDRTGAVSGRVLVSKRDAPDVCGEQQNNHGTISNDYHLASTSTPASNVDDFTAVRRGESIARLITTCDTDRGVGHPTSMLPSVIEMLTNAGHLSADPIMVRMDSNGIVKEWNDTADVLGWTREDTREKPLIENFVLPELRPMVHQIFRDGIQGKNYKFVMEVKTKYDETRFLLIDTSPVRDPTDPDNIVGLTGHARDVTREAMYDMAVRAMKANNLMLIKTANAPIFGIDRSMRVNEWNDYCIATTGFVSQEMLGKSFVEMLIPHAKRESVRGILDRSLREGQQTKAYELEVWKKKNEETRTWVINITPRLDHNGHVVGAIGVANDVTDDRMLAKRLKQMETASKTQEERLASERGVTAYFAHELRNPLHAIDSALEMMPPDQMSDSTKSLVDAMRLCTGFMSSVMNNLLDMRKMEEGKMDLKAEPMLISGLLAEVRDMLTPSVRQGVDFLVEYEMDGRDWVVGDSLRIRQVLTNIVTNSIKHTTAGSIILRASWEEGAVRFECTDTGPGIPKNEQGRLFEKFVQRGGASGTGLGLAIAKNVVDMYGGSIWFESDPATRPGTTCVITLPLEVSQPIFHEEEGACTAMKIEDALSILVIDDIPINREMLVRRLKQSIAPNASVQEAPNGEEGLGLCHGRKFDVVLVDYYMGEAGGVMVGPDVVIAMRRIGMNDTIIIGCSGSDSEASFKDAGCDLVWGKPMPSNAVVVQQLSEILSKKRNGEIGTMADKGAT